MPYHLEKSGSVQLSAIRNCHLHTELHREQYNKQSFCPFHGMKQQKGVEKPIDSFPSNPWLVASSEHQNYRVTWALPWSHTLFKVSVSHWGCAWLPLIPFFSLKCWDHFSLAQENLPSFIFTFLLGLFCLWQMACSSAPVYEQENISHLDILFLVQSSRQFFTDTVFFLSIKYKPLSLSHFKDFWVYNPMYWDTDFWFPSTTFSWNILIAYKQHSKWLFSRLPIRGQ